MRKKGHPVTFPPFNLYLGFVCDQAVAASDESFVKRLLKKLFQMDPGSDRPHHSSHSHHTSNTSHSHHTSKRGCRSKKCSRYFKRIESPSTNSWRKNIFYNHLYFRGVKHHNPNCRKLSSSSSALHDDMTASSHVSSHVSPSHQVRVGTCDTCQWYDDSDRTVLYPSQPSLMIA